MRGEGKKWIGGREVRRSKRRKIGNGLERKKRGEDARRGRGGGGEVALRRHIRRKRGLCVSCGYDLRHADHAACPECGARPKSATA